MFLPKFSIKKNEISCLSCFTFYSMTALYTEQHEKIHTSTITTFSVKLQQSDENWDVKTQEFFGTGKWKNYKKNTHQKTHKHLA